MRPLLGTASLMAVRGMRFVGGGAARMHNSLMHLGTPRGEHKLWPPFVRDMLAEARFAHLGQPYSSVTGFLSCKDAVVVGGAVYTVLASLHCMSCFP